MTRQIAAPAAATAAFRSRRGGPPLTATAAFRTYSDGKLSIGTPVVPVQPPYVVCDPMPAPALVPFNDDRMVHIGSFQRGWGRTEGDPVSARFATVGFLAWLDAAVRGEPAGPPTATAEAGRVTVEGPASGRGGDPRTASLTYDPRGPDGRLVPGRHAITVTFRMTVGQRTSTFSATIHATVGDDGLVTVGDRRPPVQVPFNGLIPLERRFAARIVAEPEEGGFVLGVQSPVANDAEAAPAFLWRATAGELVSDAGSPTAVWTPPAEPGRHVVTCAITTALSDLAVASFSHDVAEG